MEHSGAVVCASIGRGHVEDFSMLLQGYTGGTGILLRYASGHCNQNRRVRREGARRQRGPSMRYLQVAERIQWLKEWKQNPLHAQSSALG